MKSHVGRKEDPGGKGTPAKLANRGPRDHWTTPELGFLVIPEHLDSERLLK